MSFKDCITVYGNWGKWIFSVVILKKFNSGRSCIFITPKLIHCHQRSGVWLNV